MNALITSNSEAYITGLDSLKQSLNAQIDDLADKKIEQNGGQKPKWSGGDPEVIQRWSRGDPSLF